MRKLTTTLSGLLAASALLCIALFNTGCAGLTGPIKTTVDLEETAEGLPALSYSSEKDLSYERILRDPESGVIESVKFSANASDPASIQAQAQASTAAALASLASALGANAQAVLAPGSAPPATAARARTGPLIPAQVVPPE